jgi:hypothetical protein
MWSDLILFQMEEKQRNWVAGQQGTKHVNLQNPESKTDIARGG